MAPSHARLPSLLGGLERRGGPERDRRPPVRPEDERPRAAAADAAGPLLRRRGAALRVLRPGERRARSLGLPAQGPGRLPALLPPARLPARHRGNGRRLDDPRAARSHGLHVLARRLHRPADPLRPGGRARPPDAARRGQRAAPDGHRLVPPAPPAHVARRPHDAEPRVGRWCARLLRDGGVEALRRGWWARRTRATSSVMPYQEEPKDVPIRFVVETRPEAMRIGVRPPRRRGSGGRARRRQGRLRPAARERRPSSTRETSTTTGGCSRTTVSVTTPDGAARRVVRVGEGRDRQGHGHEPVPRHRARGRLPHVGRERAPRLRLVLRQRLLVDDARSPFRGRLRLRAHRPRVPAEAPAGGREDPPRGLAERDARPLVLGLRVRVEERGRDAALRRRPGRPLAGERRRGLSPIRLGLDRARLALHRGHGHGRQRPRREHEGRARLGGGGRALPARTRRSTCRGRGSRRRGRWRRWPTP